MSLHMGCKMEIGTSQVIAFYLNQFRLWLQLDNPALNGSLMNVWVVKQQVPFISQEMAFDRINQSLWEVCISLYACEVLWDRGQYKTQIYYYY